ncbi:MAG: phage tail tape measure protein [Evtepia gabavorous]
MAADGSVIIEIKGDYDEFLADLEKALKKAKERSKKSDDPLERQRKNTQLTVKELQNLDSVASKALNGIIKGFAAVATASAGALVAISKIGAEFESSFAQVETIMDTSQMSVEDMKSSIQNLSSEMGVSASELSGAVYNAISATGDTANAVSLVGDATRLATAGFTDAESALSVLTTTINAYGMSASDAESISDSLIQTQNLGVTTIDQLASAMGKAISTASAYNVNLGNLESAYVSLTKAGISTEESTTYISSMLNELGDTGSEVGKILKKETGKSFGTLMKEGKSLGDVIEVLSDHVDGSAEALMNLWGSAEAGKAANAIVSQGLDTFNDNLEKLQNSAGTTEKAYSTMADTLEHKTQMVKTEAQNLAISIYEQIKPALSDIADAALEFIRNFDFTQAVNAVKTFVAILASAAVSIGVFKAALLISDISKFVTGVKAGAEAVKALSMVTKAGTAIQTAYNAVMALTPWGAALAAVTAIAGAFVIYNAVTDDASDSQAQLNDAMSDLNDRIEEQKQKKEELAQTTAENLGKVDAEIDKTEDYIAELDRLTDANGKVEKGQEDRANALANLINNVIPGAIEMHEREGESYAKLADNIKDMLFQKEKEATLNAMQGQYEEALASQQELVQNNVDALKNWKDAQIELGKVQNSTAGQGHQSATLIAEAARNVEKTEEAYRKTTQAMLDNQEVILAYEDAAAAMDPTELRNALATLQSDIVKFTGDNKAQVDQATEDMSAAFKTFADSTAKSWSTLGEDAKRTQAATLQSMQTIFQSQLEQFTQTGAEIPQFLSNGALSNAAVLPESIRQVIESARQVIQAMGFEMATDADAWDFLMGNSILENGQVVSAATKQVADQAGEAGKQSAQTNGPEIGQVLTQSIVSSVSGSTAQGQQAATKFVNDSTAAGTAAAQNGGIGTAIGNKATGELTFMSPQLAAVMQSAVQNMNSAGESAASDAGTVGETAVNSAAGAITSSSGLLSTAFSGMIDGSVQAALGATASSTLISSKIVEQISSGISSGTPDVVSALNNLVTTSVLSSATGASGAAKSVGLAIASGVAAGINAGASQAISAASNMAKSALAAAKSALDIHSPSKAFRWIGEQSVAGLVLGLNDKAKNAQAAAGKLADVVLKETSKLYDKIAEIEAAAQKRADEKELADYEKSLAEKYERLEEAEVDERQDILDEIAELKEDWNEKQLKKQEEAQKEELQSAIDALEEMEDEYQSALDDLKSDRDSLASKLSGDNLFETDYKGETRLLNLDKDIQEIERYGNAMLALQEKGVDAGLYSEILQMEMDEATAFAEKLLSLNDDQYTAYMEAYQKRAEAAKNIAAQIYQDEFESLNQEFVDKMPDELKAAGEDAMTSLAVGVQEEGSTAIAAAKKVADGIIAEISRINAAARLRETVTVSAGSASYRLTRSTDNAMEAKQVESNGSAYRVANAVSFASAPRGDREIVLNVNGKAFARAIVNDIRAVEDQSPRIVSD